MPDAYDALIDRMSKCKRVLVTTHVRPDGDAIGTCAALVYGMKQRGIAAEVLLLSHLPTKYAFVFQELGITHHDVEQGWPGEARMEDGGSKIEQSAPSRSPFSILDPRSSIFDGFDALLVADTGTWSQLPGLQERIKDWPAPKIVLDHHLTQENWADVKLVDTQAAAAGEIAAELLRRWGVSFDAKLATALYVAIASDTGWFQFANTRPQTMRLAATLMEAGGVGGVDTDRIYQLLYQNERPERLALQTRAMQSLELLADGKLAVMTIRKQDFADTGASVPDTENVINFPLQIRTVEVSILFTEPPEPPFAGNTKIEDGGSKIAQAAPSAAAASGPSSILDPRSSAGNRKIEDGGSKIAQAAPSAAAASGPSSLLAPRSSTSPGPIRVSLRSKGQLDVAKFAEQFAGGGHARAAGLKLDTTLEDAHTRVIEAATAALSRTT